MKPRITPFINDKIELFPDADFIRKMVIGELQSYSDRNVQGGIAQMFLRLDENSSDHKLEIVRSLLKRLAFSEDEIRIFRVSQGANFGIEIETLEDLSAFTLVARNLEDRSIIGQVQGENGAETPKQIIPVTNLQLEGRSFYDVILLTEESEGEATDDIDIIYLMVGEDIDTPS